MDERNFTYMFYGFAAAWLIIAGFVVILVSRERRIGREMDNLKRIIADREKQG